MATHPQATQTYLRPGVVRRQATCPDHNHTTSAFRGGQWDMIQRRTYWAFFCKGKEGHIFLALPDRSAPQEAEDVRQWELRHEAAKTGWDYDAGGRE